MDTPSSPPPPLRQQQPHLNLQMTDIKVFLSSLQNKRYTENVNKTSPRPQFNSFIRYVQPIDHNTSGRRALLSYPCSHAYPRHLLGWFKTMRKWWGGKKWVLSEYLDTIITTLVRVYVRSQPEYSYYYHRALGRHRAMLIYCFRKSANLHIFKSL